MKVSEELARMITNAERAKFIVEHQGEILKYDIEKQTNLINEKYLEQWLNREYVKGEIKK